MKKTLILMPFVAMLFACSKNVEFNQDNLMAKWQVDRVQDYSPTDVLLNDSIYPANAAFWSFDESDSYMIDGTDTMVTMSYIIGTWNDMDIIIFNTNDTIVVSSFSETNMEITNKYDKEFVSGLSFYKVMSLSK